MPARFYVLEPVNEREDFSVHLPLDRAVLCANCDQLYRIENGVCPACASDKGVPLGVVLNRKAS